MMTVVDHVRPRLTPSSNQLGAHISRNGTGIATSQPPTKTCLRPKRADRRPAR